jgi:pyridoxine/pyridoxamine 5'-phosphate oxidase
MTMPTARTVQGPAMETHPITRGQAHPTSSTRGVGIKAQLAQVCELEAKLAEEYWQVRIQRSNIAGEASPRGERARELGKQARERINTDFNVDDPNTPPCASQQLITAATLL